MAISDGNTKQIINIFKKSVIQYETRSYEYNLKPVLTTFEWTQTA